MQLSHLTQGFALLWQELASDLLSLLYPPAPESKLRNSYRSECTGTADLKAEHAVRSDLDGAGVNPGVRLELELYTRP